MHTFYRWVTSDFFSHCTRIYPMVLTSLSPFIALNLTELPHVLESSGLPPVPNPILESQVIQSFSLLATIPILALQLTHMELKPSLLQFSCRESWEPISVCHTFRPSVVALYCPSAISECRELAFFLMVINFICCPILIPRQIFENGVFQ